MELWNTLDLAMPPINTYKSSRKDVDIKHLYKVCQDLKHFFMNEYMHAEHLVLSRIIYRMKQKFRSSKDFKSLEKVNKSLENFFRIRFVFDLNTFLELIPSRYKDKTYLPTKNLLDYVLVRLQGLVKLMERVVETCKISAFLLDVRMKLGHFWKNAVICFALVSRVYILAKYNANRICEFYGKLLPFSSQLENSESQEFQKSRENHFGINEESLKEFRGFSLDEDIGEVIEFNDKEEEPETQNVINISDYVCLSDSSLELVDLNTREMGTNNDIIVVSEQSLEKKLSINKKGPAVKTKKLNEKNRISKKKKTKKMKNPLDKNKNYVQNEYIVSNEQKINVEVKKTNIDVIVVSENVPLEKKFNNNKKGATVKLNEKDGTRKKKKTKKIKYPMNKINTINENLVVTDQQKWNVQVDKRKLLVYTDTRRVETNDEIIVVSESGPLEKKLSINKRDQ
ncbi:hypothetical protein JTB14_034635 [Gonioctena quinquepunctata]|nr:hypothetical protein JTB14_034635 [Gonioctena quinquepunctata]